MPNPLGSMSVPNRSNTGFYQKLDASTAIASPAHRVDQGKLGFWTGAGEYPLTWQMMDFPHAYLRVLPLSSGLSWSSMVQQVMWLRQKNKVVDDTCGLCGYLQDHFFGTGEAKHTPVKEKAL